MKQGQLLIDENEEELKFKYKIDEKYKMIEQ